MATPIGVSIRTATTLSLTALDGIILFLQPIFSPSFSTGTLHGAVQSTTVAIRTALNVILRLWLQLITVYIVEVSLPLWKRLNLPGATQPRSQPLRSIFVFHRRV